MPIAIIHPSGNAQAWIKNLQAIDPTLEIQAWPDIDYTKSFETVIAWKQSPGELARIQGLRCVASLGAGVEHILFDPTLPPDVLVTRIVDQGLAREMTEYICMMTLIQKRHFLKQQQYQREKRWVKDVDEKKDFEARVGILGLGELGRDAARALVALGIPVSGWSQTRKDLPGVKSFAGEKEFESFLKDCTILVCLLPLTPNTENILCRRTFEFLPEGAFVINVGRGNHLVDADLIEALESGHLSGACLDVFREEPLPSEHPFWSHPKITVTCHVSSITNPGNVARQIVDNHRRLLRNENLLNTVDRKRGY